VCANEVRVAYGYKIRSGELQSQYSKEDAICVVTIGRFFFASFCWRRWWSEGTSYVIAMTRSS
jgi:hypothetical protein